MLADGVGIGAGRIIAITAEIVVVTDHPPSGPRRGTAAATAGRRARRADEDARVALDRFATRNEQIRIELICGGDKPIGADKLHKAREGDGRQNRGHAYRDHQLDQAEAGCRAPRARSGEAMRRQRAFASCGV